MKSYFRFLSRNKLYAFINMAGLIISLMFVILLGDYTWRQYTIDSWHMHADRIYLTGNRSLFYMWPQAAEEMRQMCPEVEQTCCVMSQCGKIKSDRQEVKSKEDEALIMLADSTFFRFFDFKMVRGDRMTALDAPDKCVITEKLARQLFGNSDPIGEPLQIVGYRHVMINGEDPYDSTLVYTVSAVVKELDHTVLPNETQVIASMKRYPQVMGYRLDNHSFAYGPTGSAKAFLMLRKGMTLDKKKKMIKDYLAKYYSGGWDKEELAVTPLTDIMFAPQNNGSGMQKGDKTRVRILLAAVLAILFFAISNYINLTVANTGFRAKEMATRRLFGSSQRKISLKLIAESTLMITVSFVIGLALACCFQEDAATLFKGKIDLMSDIYPGTVSVCLGFILALGIISGIIPLWQLSRFQPIDIVKGSFRFRSKMILGKVFIIIQNIITVTMLTAALVIWLQLNCLIKAPLGYHTENLFQIDCPEGKSQIVRSQLEKMPFVEAIGMSEFTKLASGQCSMRYVAHEDKHTTIYMMNLDKTAFDLYGLRIKKDHGSTSDGYYLTEEAMRQLGYTEDDREIDWDDWTNPITGILYDFHRVNILQGPEPFAIGLTDKMTYPSFVVKTNGDRHAKASFVAMMKEQGVSDADMKWYVNSMEENIAQSFVDHRNTLKIITLFTLVAIVISVLGFIGMSLFFVRQRQKEIGIRKIMGSTSREVMWLMFRTFCTPLLLSFVIAIPLSWYIMHGWLTNFNYRITLSPWIFIVTCAFTLLVAVLSVGYQIVKAVSTNPVESIKTE